MRLSLIELRLASELRLAQGPRPIPESFRLSAKVLPRLNQKRLSLKATARLGAAAPTRRASGYQPKSCRDLTICGCLFKIDRTRSNLTLPADSFLTPLWS